MGFDADMHEAEINYSGAHSDADMHEAVINYRAGLMSTVPGLSFECCSKGYCAVQYFFNGWDQKLRR